MKLALQIVLAIVLLIVLLRLLSMVVGLLFSVIILAAIGAAVVALTRSWWSEFQKKGPAQKRTMRKADQHAEKKLKELERSIDAERRNV